MVTIPLLNPCFLQCGNSTLFPNGPDSSQLDLFSAMKQAVLLRQERGTASFRNTSHPASVGKEKKKKK